MLNPTRPWRFEQHWTPTAPQIFQLSFVVCSTCLSLLELHQPVERCSRKSRLLLLTVREPFIQMDNSRLSVFLEDCFKCGEFRCFGAKGGRFKKVAFRHLEHPSRQKLESCDPKPILCLRVQRSLPESRVFSSFFLLLL